MTVTLPADLTPMLPGAGAFLTSGIGFEEIGRAARMLLVRDLNDEIVLQQERWYAADALLQDLGVGDNVGQVEVTPVELVNFHEGPKKSLIERPPTAFPNVSVMAYKADKAADQFADQVDSSAITLFVEAMAISGPVPVDQESAHETIVHRRIQRMTEAAAIVIERNPTLLGVIHELQTPPRGGIATASWLNRTDKASGDRYLWHGSRLVYTLTRHHS